MRLGDLTCALLILDHYNCVDFSIWLVVSKEENEKVGRDSERPPSQMTGV